MSPSAAATARPWCGISPVAGSMVSVSIFSGVSWATASMSMPPSVEATMRDPAGLAIDQQREIIFLGDVDAVGDVEPLDLLAVRAGLDRDQGLAEHLGGMLADLVDRPGEAHAALGVRPELLELALAAAAGVDLRLDHPQRPGKLLGRRDRFLDAHRRIARGHRHAIFREQFLGLIFVDVHGRGP